MSEQRSLAARLAAAQADIGTAPKDGKNTHFKYSYTSAANVLSRVQKAFATHGLAIVSTDKEIIKEESNGKQRYVRIRLALTVGCDGSEEKVTWLAFGEGVDTGDKACAKAATMAVKYALRDGMLIGFGEDPEADAETDKRGFQPQQRNGRGNGAPRLAEAISNGHSEDDEGQIVIRLTKEMREAEGVNDPAAFEALLLRGDQKRLHSKRARDTFWNTAKRIASSLGVDDESLKAWAAGKQP